MKNYIAQIITVCILFFSCSKTENAPKVVEKKIDRIIISPEYLIQSKSSDVYIGLRYFKDYTDKDNITLTLNGQIGLQLSETSSQIEGNNLLFKFSSPNQNGDFKIRCVVKNDQNFLDQEQTLRIVNDFSINTIWGSLDKDYSSSFSSYADRLKTNGYTLRTISSSGTNVPFGSYFENYAYSNLYVSKSFIPGLTGIYTLIYNDLGLQQIKINNGSPNVDQNFSINKFYADVTANYGNYVSQTNTGSGKVTVFKHGAYTLSVTETPALVSTTITKS